MRKTSVYLDDELVAHLARVARREGRSQAAVLRDAVAAYEQQPEDRDFALAASGRGFPRLDDDPRPLSQIPDEELFESFGE